MAQSRRSEIELFRCLLMYGICFLHVIGFGLHCRWGIFSLQWCVVAFVFITGYFGCSFSLWKVVKLLGLGVFAAMLNTVVSLPPGPLTVAGVYAVFWKAFNVYWFLFAYIVLMLFAPMVNAGMDAFKDSPRKLLTISLPIMAFSYVWSFGYSFRDLQMFIPGTHGLGGYGGFALLAAYVGARLYRLLELERYLTVPRALAGLFVALSISAIRFGTYDSILSLFVSACAFFLFSRLRIRRGVGSWICFIAPSMFSIYLLHMNLFVAGRISAWLTAITRVTSFPTFMSAIVLAFLIFAACLAVDLLRRGVLNIVVYGVKMVRSR